MESTEPIMSKEEAAIVELEFRAALAKLRQRFNKIPDMNAVLFLIGVQELGTLPGKLTKEQKQDAMHVSVCTLLMQDGYYRMVGLDEDGWPHFESTDLLPRLSMQEQELLLKRNICRYFAELEEIP
jgi:hypothetical protein